MYVYVAVYVDIGVDMEVKADAVVKMNVAV